jgi:prephenate dehydrogenase
MKLTGPVKIVGCGLIGTSIGLRLRENGIELALDDSFSANLRLARDLLGVLEDAQNPRVILIAVPPQDVFKVLKDQYEIHPDATFIEVGGIKSELIVQVEQFSELAMQFLAVHPMAGREKSGPESARADLFESRAWIISKTSKSSPEVVESARLLGSLLGSTIYEMDGQSHDEAIATISHLPQILSTALGASLLESDNESLNLAGQGLRDVSRLADSDSSLWGALLLGNREHVLPKLDEVINRLSKLRSDLDSSDLVAIQDFLIAGREGRAKIPGKHGGKSRDYSYVPIVIDDKPGGLANIFNECAAIGVNVEDLFMEHSPGQEVGLITLALSESDAISLQKHLVAKGWLAHAPRKQ